METRSRKPTDELTVGMGADAPEGGRVLTTDEVEIVNRALAERERKVTIRERQAKEAEKQSGKALDSPDIAREMARLNRHIEENAGNQLEAAELRRIMDRMSQNIEDIQRRQSSVEHALRETPTTMPYSPPRRSEEESPAHSQGELRLHEVLQTVPSFNGSNMPLDEYVRACKRARELLHPSQERSLTKALSTRLGGRAYYVVEGERCENIAQYTDLLTTAFVQAKSVDHYRGELSMIKIQHNEHMLDFIARVKILRTAILDGERRRRGVISAEVEDEVDALAERSFIHGLPWQYKIQLPMYNARTLFDTFAAVREIDNEMRQEEEMSRPSRSIDARDTYCQYCKIPGHTRADCRRIQKNPYRNNAPPGNFYTPREQGQRPPYQGTNSQPRYRDGPPPPRGEYFGAAPTRYNDRAPQRENQGYAAPSNRPQYQEEPVCKYCKTPGHEVADCPSSDESMFTAPSTASKNLDQETNSSIPSRTSREIRRTPTQRFLRQRASESPVHSPPRAVFRSRSQSPNLSNVTTPRSRSITQQMFTPASSPSREINGIDNVDEPDNREETPPMATPSSTPTRELEKIDNEEDRVDTPPMRTPPSSPSREMDVINNADENDDRAEEEPENPQSTTDPPQTSSDTDGAIFETNSVPYFGSRPLITTRESLAIKMTNRLNILGDVISRVCGPNSENPNSKSPNSEGCFPNNAIIPLISWLIRRQQGRASSVSLDTPTAPEPEKKRR
ncbi:hypothetical protein KM043_000175 [Ampulex compressa]|nr:hypothetical protein KM043_000175 [Ampulex compressa]